MILSCDLRVMLQMVLRKMMRGGGTGKEGGGGLEGKSSEDHKEKMVFNLDHHGDSSKNMPHFVRFPASNTLILCSCSTKKNDIPPSCTSISMKVIRQKERCLVLYSLIGM